MVIINMYKKKRAAIRAVISRIGESLNGRTTLEEEEADRQTEVLTHNWKKLDAVQQEIEMATSTEKLEEEMIIRFEFDEACTDVQAKILDMKEGTHTIAFIPLESDEPYKCYVQRLLIYMKVIKCNDPKERVFLFLRTLPPRLLKRAYDIWTQDPLKLKFEQLVRRVDPKQKHSGTNRQAVPRTPNENSAEERLRDTTRKMNRLRM